MADNPGVFLDTSALFSGIWSSVGGARMILKLGEAGAIQLFVSQQVLTEIETALRAKAAHNLGALAILLDRSRVQIISSAESHLKIAQSLVSHPGDAQVLAAVYDSQVDYFVTLDRKHFLDNLELRENLPCPMGTPGDFLTWFRARLQNYPAS